MTGGEVRWMILDYQSFAAAHAQLEELFTYPDDEEQAALTAREDYYRKRLAERPEPPPTPEPPPIEKPKYRKPDRSKWKRKLLPGENRRNWWAEELLSLISKSKAFSACDQPTYTVDDRIIEEAESWHDDLRVDVRDMEWDGYEWSII